MRAQDIDKQREGDGVPGAAPPTPNPREPAASPAPRPWAPRPHSAFGAER